MLTRRGGLGQAEAEDGGHWDEEEGQGGEEEGKLNQDFAKDCLNIIINALIFMYGKIATMTMAMMVMLVGWVNL